MAVLRLSNRRIRALLCVLAVGLAAPLLTPVSAHADSPPPESTEVRLRRIEGEMRALQRKVFPDGAGKTFAPEINQEGPTAPPPPPASNAGALGDLMARMDAVEAQLKALTATSEDNQNRMAKQDDRIAALEQAQAQAAAAAAAPPPPPVDPQPAPPPAKPVKGAKPHAAPTPPMADPSDTVASPSSPQAADRAAAVAAIQRPSTDDNGEDAYSYGYHLWEAKFFPEAEAVLLDFAQKYPRHKRISYARNLLGRAYLDDNKPGAAAQWFVQNYQADKTGDRAPDSLLYLAVAMTRVNEPKRACIALTEFHDTYPAEAAGRLKGQFDAVTKMANCH